MFCWLSLCTKPYCHLVVWVSPCTSLLKNIQWNLYFAIECWGDDWSLEASKHLGQSEWRDRKGAGAWVRSHAVRSVVCQCSLLKHTRKQQNGIVTISIFSNKQTNTQSIHTVQVVVSNGWSYNSTLSKRIGTQDFWGYTQAEENRWR